MLQIIDLENNQLFTQVSAEESAIIIGGGIQTLGYAGVLSIVTGIFGDPTVQAALLYAAISPFLK